MTYPQSSPPEWSPRRAAAAAPDADHRRHASGTTVTFTPAASFTGVRLAALPDRGRRGPVPVRARRGRHLPDLQRRRRRRSDRQHGDRPDGRWRSSRGISDHLRRTRRDQLADMAHEQMPPVSGWSRNWVAAALTPQASVGCTSFFGDAGGSISEVIASRDGTQVTVSAPGMPDLVQPLAAGVPWTHYLRRGASPSATPTRSR